MTQLTGDLGFNMSTNIFSMFVQDVGSWRHRC
jgi:hypothetical protein